MSVNVKDAKSPFSKSGKKIVFSLRIDDEVYDLVKSVAAAEKRSINSQLELFIEDSLTEWVQDQKQQRD